jgi:hypothetical protein
MSDCLGTGACMRRRRRARVHACAGGSKHEGERNAVRYVTQRTTLRARVDVDEDEGVSAGRCRCWSGSGCRRGRRRGCGDGLEAVAVWRESTR